MSNHTPQEHVKIMQTPDQWPRWPALPLKRHGYDPDTGIMLAVKDHLTTVFFLNLYETRDCKRIADVIDLANNGRGSKVYTDYEAIVDDGWEVD